MGSKGNGGYGLFRDNENRTVMAHRLAWTFTHGEIVTGLEIDHMCHTRGCVRPDHLRLVTRKQNNENLGGLRADNTSGFRGVHRCPRTRKWIARVKHQGQLYDLGAFDDIELAAEAARDKRNELFTHNDLDRSA